MVVHRARLSPLLRTNWHAYINTIVLGGIRNTDGFIRVFASGKARVTEKGKAEMLRVLALSECDLFELWHQWVSLVD